MGLLFTDEEEWVSPFSSSSLLFLLPSSSFSSILLFLPSSSSLVLLDAELEEAVVLRSMVPLLWPLSLLLVLLSLKYKCDNREGKNLSQRRGQQQGGEAENYWTG